MKIPVIIKKDPYLTPFAEVIESRSQKAKNKHVELNSGKLLSAFANGHLYFGLHQDTEGWTFREWAPNALEIYLIGTFNNWRESEDFRFKQVSKENWELKLRHTSIKHQDLYKILIHWPGGKGERIPSYARRVIQDPETLLFTAQVWFPDEEYVWKNENILTSDAPFIYEAHIGMATEEYRVGNYNEFRINVLPRIIKSGYNTIQLMAIQEHPYYGSFGYHVSSFFAPSSRFGTPEDLKQLVDEAHGSGIRVIMDLIHSHSVKNENEGLANYDGSLYQFFHTGHKREHIAWDSLCFNYGKNAVIHFLLSNIQYWLKEYRFDGFRFDGVTSMIYEDHGLNKNFTDYSMYFDGNQDEDAICYLILANSLIHEINPTFISVAEEMSGYPGLAARTEEGGIGFDYRMSMGTPDYWIKIIKEKKDEDWNIDEIFYELTNKRAEEKTIGYAESHDQALVGDQTIIFRLIGKEMYYNMNKNAMNLQVDRGIALHKMIRLITIALAGNGYLNFMGNEFGHPEWIDFPRQGNNWSYHYARRQWSLVDNEDLKYQYLAQFDHKMIRILRAHKIFKSSNPVKLHGNVKDQILCFERGSLYFIFNFNPSNSFAGYGLEAKSGKYRVILDTDEIDFGGQGRINQSMIYRTELPKKPFFQHNLNIYLPARTGMVLIREKIKGIFDIP
jgi:1,4-alpha-glucan branching enzyme